MWKIDKDKIWYKVFKLLVPYSNYFPIVFGCLLCSAIMNFLQPLIIRKITDQGMVQKDIKCITFFAGTMIIVAVTAQLTGIVQTRQFAGIHNKLTFSLYEKVYKKMDSLPIYYFEEKGSAEIINTTAADIEKVSSITDQITTFSIASILQIFGGIIGLAILDWKLALLIVFLIPVKYLVVYHFSIRKSKLYEKYIENNRRFFRWMGDCINGIREMKLWSLFNAKMHVFRNLQKEMMDSYKENALLDQYSAFCEATLDILLNAVLYILGGYLIVEGEFTLGGAFAFITYSNYIVTPISFLINAKYYFAQIKPSAKRLFDFLDQPEEKINPQDVLQKQDSLFNSDKPALELEHVKFGFTEHKLVLNDVNLKVYEGEKIGIIGENGSGKSTLINLILGFYKPNAGEIRLYDMPIEKSGLEFVRKQIAVVSQEPYLFQETVEENINIDGKATDEEVKQASKKSGAVDFIQRLENGYQQDIGLDGAKVSGGERQKLAVARALLKHADILVMDEATSGYDVNSNKYLCNIICNELRNKTVIFVTHRYEELNYVDRVYRLNNGKLEEENFRIIEN